MRPRRTQRKTRLPWNRLYKIRWHGWRARFWNPSIMRCPKVPYRIPWRLPLAAGCGAPCWRLWTRRARMPRRRARRCRPQRTRIRPLIRGHPSRLRRNPSLRTRRKILRLNLRRRLHRDPQKRLHRDPQRRLRLHRNLHKRPRPPRAPHQACLQARRLFLQRERWR